MAIQSLVDGVYVIPLGVVNTFLLESDAGLVLIDTGYAGSADTILSAIRELGKNPEDLKHILITHWHPDHAGSLAALQKATSAQSYAHPQDADMIRQGGSFDLRKGSPRPFVPGPSIVTRILHRLFLSPGTLDAARIDHEINQGDRLPFLPDLEIIFAPGHSHGQVVFLLETYGGILFAADACSNLPFLSWSIGYEDLTEGKRTLKKLCHYDFEIVTFGHGGAIMKNAAQKWRRKWGKLP